MKKLYEICYKLIDENISIKDYKKKEVVNIDEKPEKQNLYLESKEKAKKDAKRKKIERQISTLEEEIKEISKNFENPEVFSDYKKLMEFQKQIEEKNSEIEKLTEEWFSLEN